MFVTTLLGRGESGMLVTTLLGRGESGMFVTTLLGRGESGMFVTTLFVVQTFEIAMFVTTTIASVIASERKRFAVVDIVFLPYWLMLLLGYR